MAEFLGNIILRAKIEAMTGLHIGAGGDAAEIGGNDNPVIRDARSNLPYIPGSSLKGKMRSLLEFATGKVTDGRVYSSADPGCEVCRPFGAPAEESRTCGPTRLLVRDAYPDQSTQSMWDKLDGDTLFTEMKSENSLDRITAAANPRPMERVVKGSKFDLDMVFGIYKIDQFNDVDFFQHVALALRLAEDSSLGGSGSRGYGQIRFHFAPPVLVHRDDYREAGGRLAEARQPLSDDAYTMNTDELGIDRSDPVCQKWDQAHA